MCKFISFISQSGGTILPSDIEESLGRLPSNIGSSIDIHKLIGKLPKPKKGFTLPGYNYAGPYNPLEKQVKFDPETGEIPDVYQKPSGKTDAVAMQHDVDYTLCGDDKKCKNKADAKMVNALDSILWKERQWGHVGVRNVIAAKQKLSLGMKKKVKDLASVYYSSQGYWKGFTAAKKLADESGVSKEVASDWLKKQAIWQNISTCSKTHSKTYF